MKIFFAFMALATLLSSYASVGTAGQSGAYLSASDVGPEYPPEMKLAPRDASTRW